MTELYLGGSFDKCSINVGKANNILFVLQTFYDMRKMNEGQIQEMLQLPKKGFFLDSGAFTFMNSGKEVNWKEYVNDYIKFINKWDIKYFVELDLYGILGVEKTEKIRKRLEEKIGKKPIPVYHGTMPLSYFRKLCSEYPYVAISATGNIKPSVWTRNKKILKQVIKIAHSYGCKVHGLGYTRLEEINNPTLNFDSIDSSSWLYGSRYGVMYKIRHDKIVQINAKDYMVGKRRTNDEWIQINMPVWIRKQNELYNIE